MNARQGKKRISPSPLVYLLAAVFALWALYGLAVLYFPFGGEFWDTRGKFGDMFGAFNALFTACGFAGVMYEVRLEYKAVQRQELHAALSGQLDTLVRLCGQPEEERQRVWNAIQSGVGEGGDRLTVEQAIAQQIDYLDRLMAGEELDFVPTYGRPSPKAKPDR